MTREIKAKICVIVIAVGLRDISKSLKGLLAALLLAVVLAGCQDSFNISALPPHYQNLFRQAAAIEGVGTTGDTFVRDEWDWSVELGSLQVLAEQAHSTLVSCRIIIDPVSMSDCNTGSIDQHFTQFSRHAIRHCKEGAGDEMHDPRADHLMHWYVPCWPVD